MANIDSNTFIENFCLFAKRDGTTEKIKLAEEQKEYLSFRKWLKEEKGIGDIIFLKSRSGNYITKVPEYAALIEEFRHTKHKM